jgi:hypothetical protein
MKVSDPVVEVIKAAPPVGYVGSTYILGYSLSEIATMLCIIYTVILIVDKAPAFFARIKQLVRWLKGNK